jgi:hypothetical protein
MKCKNCGTENPDNAKRCETCGKPPEKVKIKIYPAQIGIGSIIGLIVISIINYLYGVDAILLSGLFVAVTVSTCLTTVISYNKDFKVSYDFNPLIQSIIVGFIVSALTILMILSQDSSRDGIILMFIPGTGLIFGFIGAVIGLIINYIREKDIRLIIPFAIIAILVCTGIGYISYTNNFNYEFDTAFNNQMINLDFNDLIQPEADYYLNKTVINSKDRKSNLKKAQLRYKRMIQITSVTSLWNSEMLNHSSTDVQKEYTNALGKYIDLKLQYFNLTESRIELELKGNTKGAREKYNAAQKIIPSINKQKNLLTTISGKDPNFQKYLEKIIVRSKIFVQSEKDKLFTFPMVGPDFGNDNN